MSTTWDFFTSTSLYCIILYHTVSYCIILLHESMLGNGDHQGISYLLFGRSDLLIATTSWCSTELSYRTCFLGTTYAGVLITAIVRVCLIFKGVQMQERFDSAKILSRSKTFFQFYLRVREKKVC